MHRYCARRACEIVMRGLGPRIHVLGNGVAKGAIVLARKQFTPRVKPAGDSREMAYASGGRTRRKSGVRWSERCWRERCWPDRSCCC